MAETTGSQTIIEDIHPQDTGQKDQGITAPDYVSLTPEQRKQWLDQLIYRRIVEAGKPAPIIREQENYRVYHLNPDPEDHAAYLQALQALQAIESALSTNNKDKIDKAIREHPEVLGHIVKIHIQPLSGQMLSCIKDLGEVLAENDTVRNALYAGKIAYKLEQVTDERRDVEPFVTLYLYPNADRNIVEQALVERFSNYQKAEEWITPRYNRNVGGIVFTSRGEGRIKRLLRRDGVLDRYYEPERNYSEPKTNPQHDVPLGQRVRGWLGRH